MGLYPAASLINHSCHPNCVSYFRKAEEDEPKPTENGKEKQKGKGKEKGKEKENEQGKGKGSETLQKRKEWDLLVRAISDIDVGQEACQSYIDLYATRETRQTQLRAHYFFECECERCTSEAFAKRDSVLEALLCTAEGCKGRFLREMVNIAKGGDNGDNNQASESESAGSVVWRCCICGATMEDSQAQPRLETLALLRMEAERVERRPEDEAEEVILRIKQFNEIFLTKAAGFLHPFHVLYFKTDRKSVV